MKNVLVNTATGLLKDVKGNFYMQVIIENEYCHIERQDVFIPITEKYAKQLSRNLNLEISAFDYAVNSSFVNLN